MLNKPHQKIVYHKLFTSKLKQQQKQQQQQQQQTNQTNKLLQNTCSRINSKSQEFNAQI
jgi:hypothetical protein